MNDPILTRLHAIIKGRVQGVSFRYFVNEEAHHLGLTGWVRNLMDGSVEVIAEGPHNSLELLLDLLREGPPSARVTETQVEWLEGKNEFTSFWVRSTG